MPALATQTRVIADRTIMATLGKYSLSASRPDGERDAGTPPSRRLAYTVKVFGCRQANEILHHLGHRAVAIPDLGRGHSRPAPQPSKKTSRAMSISENPVRRYDARPMRPAQTRRQTMRVIVFVKATDDSEKGILPTTELLEAMGKFNEELVNAGIMRAGDGLKPS